ncbi:MAG: alpha-1,2-fucosyltransferase [Phycisphaerae bacterium]
MFQYAIGRVLSLDRGVPLYMDLGSYSHYSTRKYSLDVFNISAEIAAPADIMMFKPPAHRDIKSIVRVLADRVPTPLVRMVKNIIPERLPSRFGRRLPPDSRHYCREKQQFTFDETVLAGQPPLYLDGYWQNEKYFVRHRDTILREFTLRVPISEKAKAYQKTIQKTVSVSLHIRRGDYVRSAVARKLYEGVCDLDYYRRALELLRHKIPDMSVFVFSDEIAWAKANLNCQRAVFIERCADFEELFLMSCCRHNIIANSSFSWWGAWLNCNAGKIVIAPRRWHKSGDEIHTPIAESWVRV